MTNVQWNNTVTHVLWSDTVTYRQMKWHTDTTSSEVIKVTQHPVMWHSDTTSSDVIQWHNIQWCDTVTQHPVMWHSDTTSSDVTQKHNIQWSDTVSQCPVKHRSATMTSEVSQWHNTVPKLWQHQSYTWMAAVVYIFNMVHIIQQWWISPLAWVTGRPPLTSQLGQRAGK